MLVEIGRRLVAIGSRAVEPLDHVLLPVVIERHRVDALSLRVDLGSALALIVQAPKDSSQSTSIKIDSYLANISKASHTIDPEGRISVRESAS